MLQSDDMNDLNSFMCLLQSLLYIRQTESEEIDPNYTQICKICKVLIISLKRYLWQIVFGGSLSKVHVLHKVHHEVSY